MGERLSKAPVYFAAAQVRFNTILALDALVPAIQDKLRLMDFPDYQLMTVAVLNVNLAGNQAGQIPVSQMQQHIFGDAGKKAAFVLNQNSLSFRTADYETYEVFSSAFMRGLSVVHDAIRLGYTEQVGVRFLDAVLPQGNETLATYLAASVQGLSQTIKGKVQHAFSETRATSENLTVVARTIIQGGGVGFPPDLQPVTISIADRFSSYNGLHAILDTDGSYDHREPFDLERLKTVLSDVHSSIGDAFKASVTPEALKIWK